MSINLRDWNKGNPLAADHFQEAVAAIKEMMGRGGQTFREYGAYSPVLVKVTSAASGGGKYNGRILDGISNAAATGNLTMPEGMTVPTADDCLFINLPENAASTHTISNNTYVGGLLVGSTSAGLRVVASLGGGATSTYSGSITVVTSVSYNTTTHVLKYAAQTLTITNGLITDPGTTADTTIDTAVTCT